MVKVPAILTLLLSIVLLLSFAGSHHDYTMVDLRKVYSRPYDQWPAPFVNKEISWKELGVLPPTPLIASTDSLRSIVELGKILFFEPRLSGSGKISCANCHQPELSWTDKKERSLGHEDQLNKRNSPSLQNVWFYKKLFWDGRSTDLEDQAFAPINSESEMHGDMRSLPIQLKRIPGYPSLFAAAFGDSLINPDRVAAALAMFERTIISRKSRFDEFLQGDKNSLSNSELRGLHLFRTKAGCMNCHHGPLFSDNSFHNNGFAGLDKGLYQVTHRDEDLGKFKTPSLRDVMKTGPWMHDGAEKEMPDIIEKYNRGKMGPGTDKLIKPLALNTRERADLLAFLEAISSPPLEFKRPRLPG
jgi:cytochrome c peroxidase